MSEKLPEKIEDKLFKLKYKTDSQCHLNPDQSKCLQCLEKTCTIICPANVYCYNETEKKTYRKLRKMPRMRSVQNSL